MFLLGFTALICFVIIHSNGLWGFGALTATICWALGYWQITHRFRSDVTRPERVKATFFFPLGWLWTMTAGYVLLQLFAWTEPMRLAVVIAGLLLWWLASDRFIESLIKQKYKHRFIWEKEDDE